MKNFLYTLILCAVTGVSGTELRADNADVDSEEFQILSLDDEVPTKKDEHETTDTLSAKELEHLEKILKNFNETFSFIKTEKWYYPGHVKAVLEQFVERELTNCTTSKSDPTVCKANVNNKIMRVLEHMSGRCAEEGVHGHICVDSIKIWLEKMERGENPFGAHIDAWVRSQKKPTYRPENLRRVHEAPKSWWGKIKTLF